MEKVLLVLFFVIPICVLIAAFIVMAEQMMREDAERSREKPKEPEMGGLSRWELQRATAQAMRADVRAARMRAMQGKKRGGTIR